MDRVGHRQVSRRGGARTRIESAMRAVAGRRIGSGPSYADFEIVDHSRVR